MIKLYVLRLQNNKWYVGTTSRSVEERFNYHLCGQGAHWATIHRPIEIHHVQDTTQNNRLYDERTVTYQYMLQYGVHNVRGGPRVNPTTFTFADLLNLVQDIAYDLSMPKDVVRFYLFNGYTTCRGCGKTKDPGNGKFYCLQCWNQSVVWQQQPLSRHQQS